MQLTRWLAVGGDYVQLLEAAADEDAAWSAALQLAIPLTPHTFSLQVTNTATATVQGSSVGVGARRYGFEFTIPFTLARYFGRRTAQSAESATAPAEVAPAGGLLVAHGDRAFGEARLDEELRRLAAVAVEVRASEAAPEQRFDGLRGQRVGHERH